MAKDPALPASLTLYKEIQQLGFKIFLLTGRSEAQRNATETNLKQAGYSSWERLILRYLSEILALLRSFLKLLGNLLGLIA